MKSSYDAYFLDLDGTLLDQPSENEKISRLNIKIIKELSQVKPVVFSTGRPNDSEVISLMKLLDVKYAVCQDGSIVIDQDNNILANYFIDNQRAYKLKEAMEQLQMFYIVNGEKIIYHGLQNTSPYFRPWVKLFTLKPYLSKFNDSKINKILTFGLDKEQTQKLKEKWAKEFNLSLHTVSLGYSLEITDSRASKGKGSAFVCNLLNIDPKKAVHIGDTGNDVNALPEIGSFIAMGNAIDDVKKYASKVGPDFKNSGLAKLIQELEGWD